MPALRFRLVPRLSGKVRRRRTGRRVGTDIPADVSLDRNATWSAIPAELPTTFVSDLAAHPREDLLVTAGICVMDVRDLQRLTPEVRADAVHVFAIGPVAAPAGGFPAAEGAEME